MPFNTSPLAFDDVREIFDRALNSKRGIRIPCSSRGSAMVLRSRFNYFRKMDRTQNAEVYPPDHPMHKRSAYDRLILRIPSKGDPREHILFIEPRSPLDFVIEEIGFDIEEIEDPSGSPSGGPSGSSSS